MDFPDTVVICSSPKAGAGTFGWVVPKIADLAAQGGWTVKSTQSVEEARQFALESAEQGRLRCVIAAGGDGTLALLVQNLPPDTPFLPVPLGTENLLALRFGYSCQPDVVVRAISQNERFKMDAGLANDKIFLIMATAGFDAEVTRLMGIYRRGHIRRWSYGKPIWSALRSYTYPLVRVHGSGLPADLAASWAMAFNLPCYAMGLPLVSGCSAEDGLLDMCLLKKPGLWAGIGYLGNVLLRRHERLASVCRVQAKELRWESDDVVPYQLDGDFAGYLPVQITVLPKRVILVAPPRSGSRDVKCQ